MGALFRNQFKKLFKIYKARGYDDAIACYLTYREMGSASLPSEQGFKRASALIPYDVRSELCNA